MAEFRSIELGLFKRDGLQDFLDRKANSLSYSMVNHLRWDLKQIFDMAVAERHIKLNPALLLFTPREARKPRRRTMTIPDILESLECLGVRERIITKLAVLAGMRPGEIFALTWGSITATCAEVTQRVYEGVIDSPKQTSRSVARHLLTD